MDPVPFLDIVSKLSTNSYEYDINNFKYSCLIAKTSLFETNELQIGVISSQMQDRPGHVKFVLHYGNKTK